MIWTKADELTREAKLWQLELDRTSTNPMLRKRRRQLELRVAELRRQAAVARKTCQRCGRVAPVVASPCPDCGKEPA